MIKKHTDSVGHALSGIVWAIKTQHNYRVHFLLIFISVIAGILLKIDYNEWLVIFALILMGLIIETINTAIEKLGDAITVKYDENIKLAKDVSAGAMLIYSLGAVFGAGVIFLPKIFSILVSLF